MTLDDYRSQIEPATVWFFDAKNEPVNWGGVEPNAYRQATGYLAPHPNSPSGIHHEWLTRFIADLRSGKVDISKLKTNRGYCNIVLGLEEMALRRLWNEKKCATQSALTLHSARRYINLSVKWLRTQSFEPVGLTEAIYAHGHSTLNDIVVDLAKRVMPPGGEIVFPGYADSSSDTEHKAFEKYSAAQDAIREFCKVHGGTPVVFDIIARKEHVEKNAECGA